MRIVLRSVFFFAEFLLSRNFRGAFDLLHHNLQAEITLDDFTTIFKSTWESCGCPETVTEIKELKFDAVKRYFEKEGYTLPEEYDVAVTVTEVLFSCSSQCINSKGVPVYLLRLYLQSDSDDYRVLFFEPLINKSLV